MTFRIQPEPTALTSAQVRYGQKWIIICSVISILFGTGISERVISLFILGINPATTDTTLAFFFALGPLMAVLTALMSPFVALHGKKRVMIPFYLACVPFLVILAILPSLRSFCTSSTMVAAVAIALTGYGALRSMGIAGWFPLINDSVPDEVRGRFFARLRTSWQLMVVLYTAIVGWFLGHHPEPWQFQVLFGVTIVTNLMMTAGIMRIPEAPLPPRLTGHTFWSMLAEPFRDKPYVAFLAFGLLFNLAAGMTGPFALRCMKSSLGAGDNFIIWMDTVASIGAAATLPLWGRLVDRHGGRTIFALLVPSLAFLNLLWLFANPMEAHWRIIIATFYLFQGIFLFGIGVGITDMMLGSARKGHQSAYINISFVLNTVAIGVGPFLGTLIARMFTGIDWHWGIVTLDANRWVFFFRFLFMLLPAWVVTHLSREHGGNVENALQRLTSGLLQMLPSIRR